MEKPGFFMPILGAMPQNSSALAIWKNQVFSCLFLGRCPRTPLLLRDGKTGFFHAYSWGDAPKFLCSCDMEKPGFFMPILGAMPQNPSALARWKNQVFPCLFLGRCPKTPLFLHVGGEAANVQEKRFFTGEIGLMHAKTWLTPLRALWGLMVVVALLLMGAGSYKYSYWGHGFDMVDFHMPIWGTLQGRFLLVSRYNFTDTFMGLDVALGFLPAIPFYALLPSAYTLVVVQTLLLVSGALPVYLIARARLGDGWAGVGFAALYLFYPTTQFMGMAAPFQPRIPGMVLLLWAFWMLEQRRLWPYLLLLGLAMLTRTDAALVVVAFGMYAALRRLPWAFAVVPFLVGLIYFYVAITYITPQFYSASFAPEKVEVPFDLSRDYNEMWPCGVSPQACYYLHLGGSIPEIIKNILTHPVEIFFFIFQGEKLWYLFLLLGGLLFLPLLAPRELLLAAPIVGINLLSDRVYQYVITEQYQILVIPGMVIAAIYGGERVLGMMGKWGAGSREQGAVPASRFPLPASRLSPLASRFCLGMVVLVLLINIPLKNPVVSAMRNPERPERVAIMERMKAQIPPDAVVAATSFLAPHMLPREKIYFIPGGPMHHPPDLADYVFIDSRAAALQGTGIVEGFRNDPRWRLLDQAEDLLLFERME
ncbi:MAG: DUF2079 domain-containing protein [Candidatus Viridilinea halotolerans]|uniref:DUF2079 domain-containing protein n=1 Tax=Candidatus Viridilinea halotolerans TaxID=2491704 RepID=A0A426U3R6_9CHLR|nr:MAG: DUF2079 domain-containing protein [Candidatus Viridilinea halotolerans]